MDAISEAGLYASHAASSPPLPWRWRVVVAAAWLAGLALLALTLGYWGWIWFGPAVLPISVAAPDGDPERRIADARLFGVPAAVPTGGAAVSSATTGDLRLMGVFAERDGRGYALFRAGARGPLLVAAGQDVGNGVRVDAVLPDGVTLLEGGVRRELLLRAAASTEKPRANSIAVASNVKSPGCAAPSGFTGPVVRLNAELLGGMVNASDGWKALVEPGAGALIVRDQGGFARMLGLKSGDRIERANGIALTSADDIASTVLQPLTQSQQVLVAGTHDGKPQQWLLVNGGACPG